LRALDDLTVREAATILGAPEGTTKSAGCPGTRETQTSDAEPFWK